MYTWGGPFFMISGICYVLVDMGLPGLWLGTTSPWCYLVSSACACNELHDEVCMQQLTKILRACITSIS